MRKLPSIFTVILLLIPIRSFTQVILDPPAEIGFRFPDTPVDEEFSEALMIMNPPDNNGEIVVMYETPDEDIWLGEGAWIIDQGDMVMTTIHFTPSARRVYDIEMILWVITPDEIVEVPFPVYGRGGGWPHIQVDLQDIDCLIEDPEPIERVFQISNVGAWLLNFEIILDEDAEWLEIEPLEGEIDPDDDNDMDIFMTIGEEMLDNGEYQTTIVVESDDPDTPEIEIDIELTVDIQNIEPLVIELERGWSMISSNRSFTEEVIDEEGPEFQMILADIIDNVIIVKDGFGNFIMPDFDYWGIPFWDEAQGYLIKVAEETELSIEGEPIPFDTPIQLVSGWNLVAYYPDFVSELRFALTNLIERDLLELAKNGYGQFIHPDFVMGMIMTEPGQGFLIKVNADCEFQWPPEPDWVLDGNNRDDADDLVHFQEPPLTDSNMSVMFASIEGIEIAESAELACISPREEVAGAVVIEGESPWGMAVWGDDAISQDTIEGMQEGEPLVFVYWDPVTDWEMEVHYNVINEVEPVYAHNGLLIIDSQVSVDESEIPIPTNHGIISVYPNPFNNRAELVFSLNTPGEVRIGLYDMTGRLVRILHEGHNTAGSQTISVDGSTLSDGLYIVRMIAGDRSFSRKVLHIK